MCIRDRESAEPSHGYMGIAYWVDVTEYDDIRIKYEETRPVIEMCIRDRPYGAITRGQKGAKLADMAAMAPYVCGFSDDGHGAVSYTHLDVYKRQGFTSTVFSERLWMV